MKHPSTIRRELKRLRGIQRRGGLEETQRHTLVRYIRTLEWALDGSGTRWLRPSQLVPGVRCREGER